MTPASDAPEKAPEPQKQAEQPMFSIPVPLMQRVIDYLQERPYKETAALIHEVLQHNPK